MTTTPRTNPLAHIKLGPDPTKWPEPFKSRYAERLALARLPDYSKYRPDPHGYARDVLKVKLTPDQETMLSSIRDNRYTEVLASHAIGKTFTAAVAASWWYDCWLQHICYITAPSWGQALGLTFKQLKTMRRELQLPGNILDTGWVKDPDRVKEGAHYVQALNAETGEGFQGEHSAPILIVIEEGVGVPRYIWEAAKGLMTHPECFVGDTEVSASQIQAATARFYQGAVIKIATANGRNLTVTPNHPILTLRGWVPAQCLNEGDQLVASSDMQSVTSRIVPNKENVPAAVREVFESLSRTGSSARREGNRLQFHGDGIDNEVRVVYPDGFLREVVELSFSEEVSKATLPDGHLGKSLNGLRSLSSFCDTSNTSSRSVVRGFYKGLSFPLTQLAHAQGISLADAARLGSLLSQRATDSGIRYSVQHGEFLQRPVSILSDEISGCAPSLTFPTSAQVDSSVTQVSCESFPIGADLARQMMTVFPGLIALDQVVQVSNEQFSGQVYNLHTDTNWYFANGIIAHNCRMFVIGNPTDEATEFGQAASSDKFHVLSISALDHPNIKAELSAETPPFPDAVRLLWVYEQLKDECDVVENLIEDAFEFYSLEQIQRALNGQPAEYEPCYYMPSASFQGRVLGQFPTQADQQVIPRTWLKFQPVQKPKGMPEIGCDIARFGDDRTTIFLRQGPCVLNARELRKMDNAEVESALRDMAQEAASAAGAGANPKRIKIKIDITGGLGTGPHDNLKRDGYTVIGVNSSERANDSEQYKNVRSELWFQMRYRARDKRLDLSRLRKDIRERLEKELSAPKYKSPGQKIVEDKAQMKSRLGYSPDLADGCNLAFYSGGEPARIITW